MAFELPDLPYLYEDLEPVIDAETMRIHHDRHHAAYVTNLNAALEGTDWAELPVAQLLARIDEVPEAKRGAVRNNGGGHANHSLFWEIMSPDGGGHPEGDLAVAIDDTFGSVGDLKRLVNEAGTKRFGSGWAWLVHDGAGLAVTSTPNQDSPLMEALVPLLGIDVWEHAYYLTYQNRRPEYLEGWWNIVNWHVVAERYDSAVAAA
jgi:superoxide dismutase, Fe-Mn family